MSFIRVQVFNRQDWLVWRCSIHYDDTHDEVVEAITPFFGEYRFELDMQSAWCDRIARPVIRVADLTDHLTKVFNSTQPPLQLRRAKLLPNTRHYPEEAEWERELGQEDGIQYPPLEE